MHEDLPGADFTVHAPRLIDLVVRDFADAVLRSLEQNPPDGVTRADVAAYRRELGPVFAADILPMFEVHEDQVVTRAAASGALSGQTQGIAAVLEARWQSVTDQVFSELIEGTGWAAVHPEAMEQRPLGTTSRRKLAVQLADTVVWGAYLHELPQRLQAKDLLKASGRHQVVHRAMDKAGRAFVEAWHNERERRGLASLRTPVAQVAEPRSLVEQRYREAVRSKRTPEAKAWLRAFIAENATDAVVLSLKGGIKRTSSGPVVSLEVELAASADTLQRIRTELDRGRRPAHVNVTARATAPAPMVPVEARKAGDRARANLAAMELLATHPDGHRYTAAERRTLGGYSGWGGLSLEDNAANLAAFEGRLPLPKAQGLIHEYYTPSLVCAETVRVLEPFIASLPRAQNGALLALEPSAGIGRFLEAAEPLGARWTAVEYSPLSARLLRARFPAVDVVHSPFERFVRGMGHDYSLVLANPPYGPRGAAITDDPDRAYREQMAYAYFLRRASEAVAPGGISVFLIPSGFLSGRSSHRIGLRDKVLRQNHLMGAYRLPSGLFPGAMLVTDLVFLRRRATPLDAVAAEDKRILSGHYFMEHPEMVLGLEVGSPGEDDDQTKMPRWGYQVEGTFEKLPDLVERPHCDVCSIAKGHVIELPAESDDDTAEDASAFVTRARDLGARVAVYLRGLAEGADVRDVWPGLHADLLDFGRRRTPEGDHALRQEARGDTGNRGVAALLAVYGADGSLIPKLRTAPTYTPPYTGSRDDAVALADWIYRLEGKVSLHDIAHWHADRDGAGNPSRAAVRSAQAWVGKQVGHLREAGWAFVAPFDQHGLQPARDYLSGHLWPKVDALDQAIAEAAARTGTVGHLLAQKREAYTAQRAALIQAIAPVQFADIELVSPVLRYVSLSLIQDWLTERWSNERKPVRLVRESGFLLPEGRTYEDYVAAPLRSGVIHFLGYINNDKSAFKPEKIDDESLGEARRRYADEVAEDFVAWLNKDPKRQDRYTASYNRALRGYVQPQYSTAPLPIARWAPKITPRPHQSAGARRVIANRRGLLAFGVGVGKTYTGLMVLARARQEGWARRPIVLVPNSLAWKWYKDFKNALPDYRVAVVGSSLIHRPPPFGEQLVRASAATPVWIKDNRRSRVRTQVARSIPGEWTPISRVLGDDAQRLTPHIKGLIEDGAIEHDEGELVPSSRTDTPEERAAKWRRFQAGEVDAVILTYSALGRTRIDEDKIEEYVERRPSIRRQREIEQRSAKQALEAGKLGMVTITDRMSDDARRKAQQKNRSSERRMALATEKAKAWIAEILELPSGQEYDPGITWEDIGCDLLVVDEAQNFKNLYTPERRDDGAVPKFMGGNQSSNRAWQLDFRAASVRDRAGGRGIVLLSATPAKNSPLEFFTLLSYLGEDVWQDVGVDTVEAFIAVFLQITRKLVIDHMMNAEEKDCVTGFVNMDVLRDIIFRYADFKSPDQVGLKLPEVKATPVWVDLDARQDQLYGEMAERIEELLESGDSDAQGKILGMMMVLSMITLHPRLAKKWKWTEVQKADVDPMSPKIRALVSKVRQQPGCGHLVFCEPVASHWWIQEALVQAGIPRERIAILNGSTAKDTAKRQSIAERFNGNPEEGIAPEFDVVVANSIAYEGVDLQTRTCAIHHLDLPWEPATIEQRNGRGVRQGNTLDNIAIYFYLARNSMDGARFSLIQGKHGWMKMLLNDQIKETANPLATADQGRDELLLMLSRDPERTAATIAGIRSTQELEARRKGIWRLLRRVSAMATRFQTAREVGSTEPERAAILRSEAETLLAKLQETDAETWPWVRWVEAARDRELKRPSWNPAQGAVEQVPLLVTGTCLTLRDPDGEGDGQEWRVGVEDSDEPRRHGVCRVGELVWHSAIGGVVPKSTRSHTWPPGLHLDLTHVSANRVRERCPLVGPEELGADALKGLASAIGLHWSRAGWHLADDAWRVAMWPLAEATVRESLGRSYSGYGSQRDLLRVPVLSEGRLVVVKSSYSLRTGPGDIVPPTDAGWSRFLAAIPKGMGWSQANEVGKWWWGRGVPRGGG